MSAQAVGHGQVRTDDIEAALAALAAGRPVVVLDAADRENEGDLVMAAQHATPQWMAFFVRHGSGYVCVPMEAARADHLGLPLMVSHNEESMSTAFTITVDAREGVGTGISAADRARTVGLLADPQASVRAMLLSSLVSFLCSPSAAGRSCRSHPGCRTHDRHATSNRAARAAPRGQKPR